MSQDSITEVKKQIDDLYGKLYCLNDILLQRSEKLLAEGEKYSCLDIFDFYISSHALAYLKDLYLEDLHNTSIFLSSRCILEGFALKELCKKGVINSVKEELLQRQVFLIEYKYYKEFEDIADKILLPEKLRRDWEDACEFYNKKLKDDFTQSQINTIINSKIPFLCIPKTNYRKIIAETLGESVGSLYGLCSSMIHPSLNDSYKNDFFTIVMPIFNLIEKEYGRLGKSESKLSMDIVTTRGPFSDLFFELMRREQALLNAIADVFEQHFQNNYVSNTFRTIGCLLPNLAIEKQLGLTEQIKCKWKILLELFATFSHVYFKNFGEDLRYKLLDVHQIIQTQRNLKQEFDLDQAYQIYCKIYKNPCNKDIFGKNFINALGYLIDENGQVPSLTQVVLEFIKPFETDAKEGISIGRAMYLDYMESQMLSHANGYMWFANSGAFKDTNNIFIGIDMCLGIIVERMHTVFACHRGVENSKKYKTIINVLRNKNKELKEIYSKKTQLLSIPMIDKWHVD